MSGVEGQQRLGGKVAVITGGSSGIGAAAARLFAREGADVVIAARGASAGDQVVREITQAGGSALFVQTDVADSASVAALIERTEEAFDRIDILYANAGLTVSGTIEETSRETWDRVIAVNLTGHFNLAKYGVPALARAGGGAIVFTASDAALAGERRMVAYCAAKAAVVNLARALAVDCAADGIRVNCLVPGGTRTQMFEDWLESRDDPDAALAKQNSQALLGRIADPDEVANAALFLVSDDSSYVTGTTLVADGGVSTWRGG